MKVKNRNLLHGFESFIDRYKIPLGILVLSALVAVPFYGITRSMMRLAILVLIYVVLGMGLNVLVGYTGLVSLGHAGFYAIGAYASAILCTRLGATFWLGALFAAAVTAFIGLLLGLPSLRLTGTYLCIITLGFCEVVIMILKQWEGVTNGNYGIRNIPKPSFFGIECTMANGGLYWTILGIALLVALACWAIKNSSIGRALYAIKGDELAAKMMGVKTSNYKILAFVISAFITGLAGAFYATINNGFIEPGNFTFDTSIMILSVVIVGGMGTTRGMVFGAVLLELFPEFTRFLDDWRYVIYGVLLVVMMRFRPQGVLGWQSTLPYRKTRQTKLLLKQRQQKPEAAD